MSCLLIPQKTKSRIFSFSKNKCWFSFFKAQEISAWLENCNLEVTHFIALDDLNLTKFEGSEFLENYFVQTNASKGITFENIEQMKDLLELSFN